MNKEKLKEKLKEEKVRLVEELGAMGKIVNKETGDWEASPEDEMNFQEVQDEADMAERAEDFEERSSKVNLLEKRLQDINQALEEIETDKYGVCKSCGKTIEEDRLVANPAAQTCKECMN